MASAWGNLFSSLGESANRRADVQREEAQRQQENALRLRQFLMQEKQFNANEAARADEQKFRNLSTLRSQVAPGPISTEVGAQLKGTPFGAGVEQAPLGAFTGGAIGEPGQRPASPFFLNPSATETQQMKEFALREANAKREAEAAQLQARLTQRQLAEPDWAAKQKIEHQNRLGEIGAGRQPAENEMSQMANLFKMIEPPYFITQGEGLDKVQIPNPDHAQWEEKVKMWQRQTNLGKFLGGPMPHQGVAGAKRTTNPNPQLNSKYNVTISR